MIFPNSFTLIHNKIRRVTKFGLIAQIGEKGKEIY